MKELDLKIKIFADGADLAEIEALHGVEKIEGFTTNPTLMRQAGVADYETFARAALEIVTDKPISFEVFADDLETMEKQARVIASWGPNVNVKIPVTNTKGEFVGPILKNLTADGVQVNVTAMMNNRQVAEVAEVLSPDTPAIVSVFAGRIADTGRDPVPYMQDAVRLLSGLPKAELLWASPREVLNIYQADMAGCGIITVTGSLLKKLGLYGKDLDKYSLETVEMFYNDAAASNFTIRV
jgi:transaldolase